jgi:hypothetical protein
MEFIGTLVCQRWHGRAKGNFRQFPAFSLVFWRKCGGFAVRRTILSSNRMVLRCVRTVLSFGRMVVLSYRMAPSFSRTILRRIRMILSNIGAVLFLVRMVLSPIRTSLHRRFSIGTGVRDNGGLGRPSADHLPSRDKQRCPFIRMFRQCSALTPAHAKHTVRLPRD